MTIEQLDIKNQKVLNASVIIPTLGRLEKVTKLCQNLLDLAPLPIEILVIFQEPDEYERFKREDFPPVIKPIIIKEKSAVKARNTGIKNAQGEFLVFLDDDCTPVNVNWLERILQPLNDSKICLVTGAVMGWGGISGKLFFTKRAFLLIPIILEPIGNPESKISGYCHTVAGGNFAARSFDLKNIGGFDESFDSPSLYEEIELSIRMKRLVNGYAWFESSASVNHDQDFIGGMRATQKNFSEEFVVSQRSKLIKQLYHYKIEQHLRRMSYILFRKIVSTLRKIDNTSTGEKNEFKL
jgi:glycosyltransferase involved in cell wall biosynthesis